LERHIRGTGFGLSPNGVDTFHTPNTTGLDGGSNSRKALKQRIDKWPTPQVSDSKDRGNLSNPSIQRRMEIGKQVNLQMCVSQTSGQLNPTWVEWLMGWPQGWTELKPSEMDKSPSALLPHGES
jgi:DNA (cytosine-5)-methyltransferase 1